MSRQFNTKKYIIDVQNDKYVHQRTVIRIVAEEFLCFLRCSQRCQALRHTLTCCLTKLRSSLEAGKKQLRVWLEYVCSVAKMLFYPSFRVLLLSPYDSSKKIRSGFEEGSKMHIITSICGMSSGAGFVYLQTYVNKPLDLRSFGEHLIPL